MGPVKKPTIYDVASRAGVAASTVSRAFGVPGRISEPTRLRIIAAADELGYSPNPHARALQSGRHRTIAMLLSDITNPHFFELIRGAEQRAKASANTLVIVNGEESPRIELEQLQTVAASVDGFVLAVQPADRPTPCARWPPGTGSCSSTASWRGLASVTLDTTAGCRQILEHLASLGHREFTYCAGPPSSWMGAARWAALSSGAEAHGLRARRIGPYTPTVSNGAVAADAALREDTTALIAHNDLLAIGIMRRLDQPRRPGARRRQRRGLRRHLRRRLRPAQPDHPRRPRPSTPVAARSTCCWPGSRSAPPGRPPTRPTSSCWTPSW